VDASASKVASSVLKVSNNLAPLVAVLAAAIVIATLAAASVATARATHAAMLEFDALRASQSALIQTEQDVLDEETGIRGYAATADRDLLAPYAPAMERLPDDFRRLRAALLLAGRTDLASSVDELADLEAQWNTQIGIPTLQAPDPRKTARIQARGKAIVDRFRSVNAGVQNALARQLRRVFSDMNARILETTYISALLAALMGAIIAFATALAGRARKRNAEDRQLRSLVSAIPQIVWIADALGNVAYLNGRWYEYTGQSAGDPPATGWLDAVHPEDLKRMLPAWHASVRSGEPFELEYRLRDRDGEYHWFFARALDERDARGSLLRWIGTCTDVDAQHSQFESVQRVANAFAQAQLPDVLPAEARLAFDATYLPAEDMAQIGGDWYDAFALDADRYFFSLGDVTGHGLDAALTMSRIRQAIFSFASLETDPAEILERTNRVLRAQDESVASALCGIVNARTGDVRYASAGHPPSLIVRAHGEIEELTSGAPPLGIEERVGIAAVTALLRPGDRLVCYTDGIIENDRDIQAGGQMLRQVLRALTPFEYVTPARAIRERILGGRRGRDDVAVLVISRLTGAGVAGAAQTPRATVGKG
jgi:PAS domain S-box-containing protein